MDKTEPERGRKPTRILGELWCGPRPPVSGRDGIQYGSGLASALDLGALGRCAISNVR